jgi:hypothetical protein
MTKSCATTSCPRMMGAAEFVYGINATARDPICPDSGFTIRDGYVDCIWTPAYAEATN